MMSETAPGSQIFGELRPAQQAGASGSCHPPSELWAFLDEVYARQKGNSDGER